MADYHTSSVVKRIPLRRLQEARPSGNVDEAKHILEREFIQSKSANFTDLLAALEANERLVVPRHDPRTQIFMLRGKSYTLPDPIDQAFFFGMYEKCYTEQCILGFAERQDRDHSAIFVDFDILQDDDRRRWQDLDLDRLAIMAVEVLAKMFDIHVDFGNKMIHVGFQIKPRLVESDDPKYDKFKTNKSRNIWKDGIHMYVLSTLISRAAKRYFMDIYQNSVAQYFGNRYLNSSTLVDKNSAHVPVFLLGSTRDHDNKPPYIHHSIWEVKVPDVQGGNPVAQKNVKIFRKNAKLFQQPVSNMMEPDTDDDDYGLTRPPSYGEISVAHEYSVNFCREEKYFGIINKIPLDPKPSMIHKISPYESKKIDVGDDEDEDHGTENTREMQMFSNLKRLTSENHQALIVQQLLEIMHPARSIEYQPWIHVIWTLANINSKYKCLAELFSRKDPSFAVEKFDIDWGNAVGHTKQDGQSSYKISSLYWWAKQDAPDKFIIIIQKDIENVIMRCLSSENQGKFQQYDIARLMDMLLSDRYAIDIAEAGGRELVLFEFVLPEDGMSCRPGEPYKWRISRDSSFLHVFLSEVMAKYMRNVSRLMENKIPKDEDDADAKVVKRKAKYYITRMKNLDDTINKLNTDGFKNGCISQFKHLIATKTQGFSATLNIDPYLLGVGGGIVIMKRDGSHEFQRGIHPHRISQFTTIDYVEYDPTHPITKKLLMSVRQAFADHEPDTHNWFMHYCASAVDGTVKDPYFVIGFGDGSNAKSYVSELQRNTLGGTYAVTLPVSSLTSKSTGGQANPDLIQLVHARWCAFSETNAMERVNTALIKHLTGQEHIAMRGLFKDMVNIKPHCVYFMLSNHLVELSDTSYGAFRRIKIIPFRMQFCIDGEDFDPTNPFHRIADQSLAKEFNNRPDVCARWLSILLHYRESLFKNYDGTLAKIPHPHIIIETNNYRSTQDKINVFVNARGVITRKTTKQSLNEAMELYIAWYLSAVDSSMDLPKLKNGLAGKLAASAINKYIKKDATGTSCIVGFRFLKPDEKPAKGEIMYSAENTIQLSEDIPAHLHEAPDSSSDKSDGDSDSDDDEKTKSSKKAKREKKRAARLEKKASKQAAREAAKDAANKDDDGFELVPNIIAAAAIQTMTGDDQKFEHSMEPGGKAAEAVVIEPFNKAKEGEKFKADIQKAEEAVKAIKPETVDQFYERKVREWLDAKAIKEAKPKADDDILELLQHEKTTNANQTEAEYKARVLQMQNTLHINASLAAMGVGVGRRSKYRQNAEIADVDVSFIADGLQDRFGDAESSDSEDADNFSDVDLGREKKAKTKTRSKSKSKGQTRSKSKKRHTASDTESDVDSPRKRSSSKHHSRANSASESESENDRKHRPSKRRGHVRERTANTTESDSDSDTERHTRKSKKDIRHKDDHRHKDDDVDFHSDSAFEDPADDASILSV